MRQMKKIAQFGTNSLKVLMRKNLFVLSERFNGYLMVPRLIVEQFNDMA